METGLRTRLVNAFLGASVVIRREDLKNGALCRGTALQILGRSTLREVFPASLGIMGRSNSARMFRREDALSTRFLENIAEERSSDGVSKDKIPLGKLLRAAGVPSGTRKAELGTQKGLISQYLEDSGLRGMANIFPRLEVVETARSLGQNDRASVLRMLGADYLVDLYGMLGAADQTSALQTMFHEKFAAADLETRETILSSFVLSLSKETRRSHLFDRVPREVISQTFHGLFKLNEQPGSRFSPAEFYMLLTPAQRSALVEDTGIEDVGKLRNLYSVAERKKDIPVLQQIERSRNHP